MVSKVTDKVENVENMKNVEKISILLHHVIFSYEQAHEKLVGKSSKAILQELIKGLANTFELGEICDISKSESLQVNLQAYIDYLNSTDYFENVMVNYRDGSYVFEIKEREFAKRDSHIKLSNKHTCPFAILAAAVIYYSTEKNCRIHETDFDIHGSRTIIEQIERA